ncbi:MAG: putative metal-binding motif-containing protein [Myxococcales bacterium]|nr:putative metal-binding motif-containing protein [Myxococcales bacterium]
MLRSSHWRVLVGLSLLSACTAPATPPADAPTTDAVRDAALSDASLFDGGTCVDMDNDGHPSAACGGDDCDDNNARRSPSAREICDSMGTDEDCNPCTVGEVSPGGVGGDGDRDEDGFPSRTCFNVVMGARPMCAPLVVGDAGDDAGSFERLTVSDTEVRGRDCDDTTRTRSPAVSERCDERLVDENCNGTVNEGCECPTEADPSISRRCAGAMGECARGTQDCVDGRWSMCSIAPVMTELCDGRDDNCDGTVDEGLRLDCYRDVDGDGLAASGATPTQECGVRNMAGMLECPAGFTPTAPTTASVTDCDDSLATGLRRSPRNAEVPCNMIDDDCNAITTDSCPGGQACGSGGACACPSGQQFCGGRCQTAGACTRTNGACTNTGTWVCPASGTVSCSATTPTISTEIPCNGRDENCNGMGDDSACPVSGQSCSGGACNCPSGQAACGSRCQPVGGCTAYAGQTYCQFTGTLTCNAGSSTTECRGTVPTRPSSIFYYGSNSALSHQCGAAGGSGIPAQEWRMTSPTTTGCYAVYGPYIGLPRGNYRMEVRLSRSLSPGAANATGLIDVYAGGRTLGSQALSTSGWLGANATMAISFSVTRECETGVEFRVRVDTLSFSGFGGTGFFSIQAIQIFGV